MKDELRTLLGEIDDWLRTLQDLAQRCEESRDIGVAQDVDSNPKRIRTAAKALYSALLDQSNTASSNCCVEFKLEQERARSDYFDRSLGSIDYIDEGGTPLKLPLLVTGPDGKPARVLLVAESIALDPVSIGLQRLRIETSLENVVSHLVNTPATGTYTSIALSSPRVNHSIVIHGIPDPNPQPQSAPLSFDDLMRAQSTLDPLIAGWKRLQLACTIAVSVLHLHETGWISDHLRSN